MEESTRTIMAYGSLLVGFPMIAAKMIWCVPGTIAASVLTRIAGRLDLFVDAIAEGLISFFLTCQLFEHLGISMAWHVPLILMLVTSLWNHSQSEGFKTFPFVSGIIAGIVLYPGGLVYPPIPLIARM